MPSTTFAPAVQTHSSIATDSARMLRSLTGDDATATLESDPHFRSSNPGAEGSSENLPLQMRDTDDSADSDEEIEEGDEEDEEEDDDEEDEEEESRLADADPADDLAAEGDDAAEQEAEANNRNVIVDKALRM